VVLHNDSDRFESRAPQVEATANASPDAVTTRVLDAGTEGALVALCAIPGNSVVQLVDCYVSCLRSHYLTL